MTGIIKKSPRGLVSGSQCLRQHLLPFLKTYFFWLGGEVFQSQVWAGIEAAILCSVVGETNPQSHLSPPSHPTGSRLKFHRFLIAIMGGKVTTDEKMTLISRAWLRFGEIVRHQLLVPAASLCTWRNVCMAALHLTPAPSAGNAPLIPPWSCLWSGREHGMGGKANL